VIYDVPAGQSHPEDPWHSAIVHREARLGSPELERAYRVWVEPSNHAFLAQGNNWDYDHPLPVPTWLQVAWTTGAPLEPLLDWLAEQYGTEHPALLEALTNSGESEHAHH
jgi:hypothetical protein